MTEVQKSSDQETKLDPLNESVLSTSRFPDFQEIVNRFAQFVSGKNRLYVRDPAWVMFPDGTTVLLWTTSNAALLRKNGARDRGCARQALIAQVSKTFATEGLAPRGTSKAQTWVQNLSEPPAALFPSQKYSGAVVYVVGFGEARRREPCFYFMAMPR
jgi:hypothetical protein